MKLVKKMVFDLIPSVALNAAAVLPPTAFTQPEAFVINMLRDIKRFVFTAIMIPFAAARPVETESSRGERLRVISFVKASTAIAKTKLGCLKGKCVLCVGGQLQMYPAYRQIVEDAGGQFLGFHGAADVAMTNLQTLLNDADLVICPIDCVRHEAFFVTKNYCEHSGKPCVMLDKSRITTFYNGIRMLKKYVADGRYFSPEACS